MILKKYVCKSTQGGARGAYLATPLQPFQSADPPVRMELEGLGSTERIPAPAEAVPAETDAVPASTDAASQPTEIALGTRRYLQRQHQAPEKLDVGSDSVMGQNNPFIISSQGMFHSCAQSTRWYISVTCCR